MQAFEVRVTRALSSTLNLHRTVQRVLQLAVPDLAQGVQVAVDGATRTAGTAGGPSRTWPLRWRGSELGALRLDFEEPPTADRVARVEVLVRAASVALFAARTLSERNALVDTLRTALVPPALPDVPGYGVAARYRPTVEAALVGGDFYDVWQAGAEWAFVLGDVSGKGVDAAVMTGQVRTALRTATAVQTSPAAALHLVDGVLTRASGQRFATLVHGRLGPDGTVILAGAGHPWPLHLRSDGTVAAVPTGGTVLGMLRAPEFVDATVRLAPGESLVLWTDGVTEARVGRRMLGEDAVVAIVADSRGLPAATLAERVEQLAMEHLEGAPHDDLAVLVVQRS